MQRLLPCILAAMALCALAAACAPLKPASPSMFFGNCITPPGLDPCDSDMSICKVYEDITTTPYASAGACRTACNQAFMRLSNQYAMRDCGYMVERGSDLCEQQCLRLYPARK